MGFLECEHDDLLKVYKTFFNYLESEGHIESSPAKRIRNMKLPKLKLRTFTEKNIMDMINYYSGRSFIEIRNRAMIAMMFDTGVRLSELMELVETQIHEESRNMYIFIHCKSYRCMSQIVGNGLHIHTVLQGQGRISMP